MTAVCWAWCSDLIRNSWPMPKPAVTRLVNEDALQCVASRASPTFCLRSSRVCGFPAGPQPPREIRPKITRGSRSWRSAGVVCPYLGIGHYCCWRRVRPKSPHANVKIGTGPRKSKPKAVQNDFLLRISQTEYCSIFLFPPAGVTSHIFLCI